MRLTAINNAIEALQTQETTVNSVQELAALYIVKDHLENAEKTANSAVENELHDILPAYRKYCDIKRKFQLGESVEKAVESSISMLCKEIDEFIHKLYSNTDTSIERRHIKNLISDLNRAI